MRPLELGWGDVPQRRVPADAVVEHLAYSKIDARASSRVAYLSWWTSSRFSCPNVLSTTALSQHCPAPLMLHVAPSRPSSER